MALKFSYSKDQFENEVEEGFRSLYSERNGQMVLTGITGAKSQEDVDRVQNALNAEKTAHKATKDRLRPLAFNGHSIVEMGDEELKTTVEAFDAYEELKTKADGAGQASEEKINQLVEQRINAKLKPIERERDNAKTELKTAGEKIAAFEAENTTRTIHDKVREARIASKVIDSAEPDVLMLAERVFEVTADGRIVTKDKVGVTPGIEADIWLQEMQDKRPHWWPDSQGGGATGDKGSGGATGDNPWTAKNWNLTKQGEYLNKHGEAKAEQAAKAAGTSIGGPKPSQS